MASSVYYQCSQMLSGTVVQGPISGSGGKSSWLMKTEFDGTVTFHGPVNIDTQASQPISEQSSPCSCLSSQPGSGQTTQTIEHNSVSSTTLIPSSQSSEVSDQSEEGEMMSPVALWTPNSLDSLNNQQPIEWIWHGEFSRLFNNFPHSWILTPALLDPIALQSSDWKEFHDSAKVRFLCLDCNNGWTSMKGRVVFWYGLGQRVVSPGLVCWEGKVLFRLFGQKCQKCKSPNFQPSLWYEPEVIKVVRNIHAVISHNIYGYCGVQIIKGKMRNGRPTKEHNAESCEACASGICSAGLRRPTKDSQSSDITQEILDPVPQEPTHPGE